MILAGIWAASSLTRPLMIGIAAQLLAGATPALSVRSITPADSLRLLRRARGAQADFEIVHRNNLPVQSGGGGGSWCDARIGRICYWNDDDSDEIQAPLPESPRVIRARAELVSLLDSLASVIPGDDWIAGQLVRYEIDASRTADAERVARNCHGTRWWCLALQGYALYEEDQYAAADSAYTAAVSLMPQDEHCRWTDLSLVLSDQLADRYDKMDCARRDSLAARVWWLGAPLYLVDAHELRTEHFARVTRTRLEERARSPQFLWGDDVRDLIVRYGWPTWYTRDLPPMGSMREPIVTGHDPTPTFAFLPRREAVDSPYTITADSWELKLRDAPARYAPRYVRSMHSLDHQIAIFRRGDSALVVGVFDASGDTTLAGRRLQSGLFLSSDESTLWRTTRQDSALVEVMTAKAPWRPLVVSLEVLAPDVRRAARARLGRALGPSTGRISASDLLLYAPRDGTPNSLADALPLALGSTRVSAVRPLGLFWETYGLDAAGENVSVSVTIQRSGPRWFRRAAERLHLVQRGTPLSVRWREKPAEDGGVASRALAVDLSHLGAGKYEVQLTLAPENGQDITVSRQIEIVR